MAPRKRAAGAGRKPLDPRGVKDILLRTPLVLVRQIEHLADQHGIKRTEEIRAALENHCVRHNEQALHVEALLTAIGMLVKEIERRSGKRWNEDATTAATLRKDLDDLVFHFTSKHTSPKQAASATASPEFSASGFVIATIENAERYKKPYGPIPGGFVHDRLPSLLHHLQPRSRRGGK